MAKEFARQLINAGVHFGHGTSRWNPKMAPFIFSKRGNIHIIDIRKTLSGILLAKKLLVEVVSSGRDVVFVGTKRQAQKAVQDAAQKCEMHYISQRWLGGTLTNFRTIRARVQRLEELEALEQEGAIEAESKKLASRLKREFNKIKTNLEGIRKMARLPGALVVVDAKNEYISLREAKKLNIATVGIIDTNSDPDNVDVPIPANDDSYSAINIILSELADAIAIGKTMYSAKAQTSKQPKRPRSRRPALARADSGPSSSVQSPSSETPAGGRSSSESSVQHEPKQNESEKTPDNTAGPEHKEEQQEPTQ